MHLDGIKKVDVDNDNEALPKNIPTADADAPTPTVQINSDSDGLGGMAPSSRP